MHRLLLPQHLCPCLVLSLSHFFFLRFLSIVGFFCCMTNAWKHLYLWKSRGGRASAAPLAAAADPEEPEDSSHRRPLHRHGHGSRFHNRQDPNPSPNLPRSRSAQIRARNLCLRAGQLEHELAWLDRRRNGDIENGGASVGVGNRTRLIGNNQLPDAVLQARERLLERLGSVSLTGTRESITASGISGHESAVSHDSRNREDETLRDQFNSNVQHVDFIHNASNKFSGVNWEALCTRFLEVFRNPEEIGEITASQECPICLDCFCEGDGLIRLHCGHWFHPMCLQPWVRTCSDCPYCRADITC